MTGTDPRMTHRARRRRQREPQSLGDLRAATAEQNRFAQLRRSHDVLTESVDELESWLNLMTADMPAADTAAIFEQLNRIRTVAQLAGGHEPPA